MTNLESLNRDITSFEDWIYRRVDDVKELSIGDLAVWKESIDKLVFSVGVLADDIVRKIASSAPKRRGGVMVEDSSGSFSMVKVTAPKQKQVLEKERLVAHVLARAIDARRVDEETGEVLEREADAVMRVFVDVYPTDKPRVGKLKDYGIDISEFREFVDTGGAAKVEVVTNVQ